MLTISLTIACSRYIYDGVILHAHPVRGESHNQRNTTGEVATEPFRWNVNPKYLYSFFSGRRVPFCRRKEIGPGLCFLVNRTAADLVLDSLKPQSSHLLHTFVKERWHSRFKRLISELHSQKQKSSAYRAACEVIRFGRSFIIKEKTMGLRTLPCGVSFSRR